MKKCFESNKNKINFEFRGGKRLTGKLKLHVIVLCIA